MAHLNWFTRPIGMMKKYGFKNHLHTSCTTKFAWLPFARSPKENIRLNKSGVYSEDSANYLDYLSNLNVNAKANTLRFSNIICTIGPASADVSVLEALIEAGMNIARLNFSHGTHQYHTQTVVNIRRAVENVSQRIGVYYPLAIALDTKGPEIRTGVLADDQNGSREVSLNNGDRIRLSTDKKFETACTDRLVYVDYENIVTAVRKGDSIYVDDGLILLSAQEVGKNYIDCVVENGGMLGSQKGINLPSAAVDLPAVSEKDKADLKFAVDHNLDIVFASFIRNVSAVHKIREILGEHGKNILIISKIENMQGINNLQSIIEVSNGIMVARGDLGIEIPPEKVFLAQKFILAQCNMYGKPGICATQMLESMTQKPRATRAESSDVANAIIDGADCVMLSGETAKGSYPVECVRTMDKLCREAESARWFKGFFEDMITIVEMLNQKNRLSTLKIAAKAVAAAHEHGATVIGVDMVGDGDTGMACSVAQFRPRAVILAVTDDSRVARQCHLHCGVVPVVCLPKTPIAVDTRRGSARTGAFDGRRCPTTGMRGTDDLASGPLCVGGRGTCDITGLGFGLSATMETDDNKDIAESTHLVTEIQPVTLDMAIEMVGFGKFHYYILFICGSLFAAVAISVTSVSFIVPSAQCDFQMTSIHKGLLNGAAMIGMFTGSFIWGYLADSKGRRYALIFSMLVDGCFSFLSSVSQIYPILIFCRLMSGFGVSGATVLYSYLGEFVNNKYREKFLCWMEMFWTAGIIILPCVAWLIIPQTFRLEYGFFLFKSWNLFAIICCMPSIVLACLLMWLPESPKFLLTKARHDDTVECLRFVYVWNHGNDEKFPVTSLVLPDYVEETKKGFFGGLYDTTVNLFTSNYKVEAIITCIIQFCSTTSYYMLMLWFPELMNRFRYYETLYDGERNKTTMCEIVSLYKAIPEEMTEKCNDTINESVYVNIVIIGIACIPTSLIVPLFVNKLGLRFFLVVSFIGSGVSAALLYYITTSTQNLVLSAVFESLSSAGISLMYCIAVEIFPTEFRGMAVSIGSMFGKIGALLGNVIVGVFIDVHCIVPILVSCSFLLISGLLVLTLPKSNKSEIK